MTWAIRQRARCLCICRNRFCQADDGFIFKHDHGDPTHLPAEWMPSMHQRPNASRAMMRYSRVSLTPVRRSGLSSGHRRRPTLSNAVQCHREASTVTWAWRWVATTPSPWRHGNCQIAGPMVSRLGCERGGGLGNGDVEGDVGDGEFLARSR